MSWVAIARDLKKAVGYLFKREGSGFYIWLCLAIILPMVIYGDI
jgi:hypothetical protein